MEIVTSRKGCLIRLKWNVRNINKHTIGSAELIRIFPLRKEISPGLSFQSCYYGDARKIEATRDVEIATRYIRGKSLRSKWKQITHLHWRCYAPMQIGLIMKRNALNEYPFCVFKWKI